MRNYTTRFNQVIRHIHQHLDTPPTIAELSALAHFSPFHFHRQFTAFVGMSPGKYVQLQRLKRASYQLAFRPQKSVLDIALDTGFKSPEAFSHAFNQAYLQSPSHFRRQPNWQYWSQHHHTLNRRDLMPMTYTLASVNLVELPVIELAVLEHRGPPENLGASLQRFIQWRRQRGMHPSKHATYNLVYDDPDTTPGEDFRFDLAVQLNSPLPAPDDGLIAKTIPAGRYAKLRHLGSDTNLNQSFEFLYGQWLPQSGEEPGDFPCFLQRLTLFPEVAEVDMITDIYLPLRD